MHPILKYFTRPERKEIAMVRQETKAVVDGILNLQTQLEAAVTANAPLNAQVADLTQKLADSQNALNASQASLATAQAALAAAQGQVAQDASDEADGLAALHKALGDTSGETEQAPEGQTAVVSDPPLNTATTGNAFLDVSQGAALTA